MDHHLPPELLSNNEEGRQLLSIIWMMGMRCHLLQALTYLSKDILGLTQVEARMGHVSPW